MMQKFVVKEVVTKKDLKKFITFVDKLYEGCDQFVPPLHKGQEHDLMKAAPLAYCSRKMWIAENLDGEVVGRICAMINPRYNEKYGKKRVRFGWFDLINDIDVARLLIGTAEVWAKANGMEEIHGPLYYNTLGRQGMLIEGYDKLAPFSCLYNYPYYADLVQQLGFEKECDWVQYMMPADKGVGERMKAISDRMMQRHQLKVADFDKLKKDKLMVRKFFKIYNESFDGIVHNFIPFTDEEIEEECKQIMSQLSGKLCCVLMDEDDEVAAFGIATPCLSRAMQKAKGSLFPFGWWHVLKALRTYENIDLMINGAAPKWQNTGISAVFHGLMADQFKAAGCKWALANPQVETNLAVNVWERYDSKLWMRRRCWIKKIK